MSDEIILRMVELDGEAAPHVTVKFAAPIAAAREVNGQEQPVGPATLEDGVLETSFTPYQPRTFALRLGPPPAMIRPAAFAARYVARTIWRRPSNDDTKSVGGFDSKGDALPAEMLPSKLEFNGVEFHLAPAATGKPDAVIARGPEDRAAPRRLQSRVHSCRIRRWRSEGCIRGWESHY